MAESRIAVTNIQVLDIEAVAVVGVARRIVVAVTPVADHVHIPDRDTLAIDMYIDLTPAVQCRLGDDMSAIATIRVPPDV